MKLPKRKIGLALSGGGYRATAFHLGTLNKLNELGVLQQIDVLSTISGGSITGAAWCLHKGDYLTFHNNLRTQLQQKSIIGFVLRSWVFIRLISLAAICFFGAIVLTFTSYAPLSIVLIVTFIWLLSKFQFKIFPVSKVIEKAYNKYFFNDSQLKDLNDTPVLAVGSSNLHTGRPFTFSKKKMSDSSYSFRAEFNPPIEFKPEEFPVARAVMASSCVPSFFSPVGVDQKYFKITGDFDRAKPVLVDGGIYDNQGIQKLTQPKSSYECEIVIVSDAGGNFIADKRYPNFVSLLMRTVDLFMFRIKTTQMVQNIYRNVEGRGKPIAYFSLGWDIENAIPGFIKNLSEGLVLPEVIDAHDLRPEWLTAPAEFKTEIANHLMIRVGYERIKNNALTIAQKVIARNVSTNLTKLSKDEVDCLIRHAENLTEIQLKLYCPTLIQWAANPVQN